VYPTYYLHLEREDGKKVSIILKWISVKPVLRGHLWDKEKIDLIRQVTEVQFICNFTILINIKTSKIHKNLLTIKQYIWSSLLNFPIVVKISWRLYCYVQDYKICLLKKTQKTCI
jgi:hypothetical protein